MAQKQLCYSILRFLYTTVNLEILLCAQIPAVGMWSQGLKFHIGPSPTHTEMCRSCRKPGRKKRGGKEQNNKSEEERARGKKEEMAQLPARVKGGKSSEGAGREQRKEEKRLGNSRFHTSPVTTVRADISLLVLAGGSQAVRERSGKLQRDRPTVRLSLSLIA